MNIPNDIKKRIRQSKQDYDLNSERAELLKRNEVFLKELEGIKNRLTDDFFRFRSVASRPVKSPGQIKNRLRLRENWPPVKLEKWRDICKLPPGYGRGKKLLNEWDTDSSLEKMWECENLDTVLVDNNVNIESKVAILEAKIKVVQRYVNAWIEFCTRWDIDWEWIGELSDLSEFMNPLVAIRVLPEINPDLPICISIGPWTSLDDIRDKWGEIKLLMKSSGYERPAKNFNFGRDLSWYDLNKKFKLSPWTIAKYWIGLFPGDIDLMAIKRAKRDPNEKGDLGDEDAAGLLSEIRTDPAMADLKARFDYERRSYIAGPHSQFVDLIKKTIKNMEERVRGLSAPPVFKPKSLKRGEK